MPGAPITLMGVARVRGKERTSKVCSSDCEHSWFIYCPLECQGVLESAALLDIIFWHERCENSSGLFSIKNHLALNKRKKPLWCGEFFQQIQSDGAQLILLCKCNIDMSVTWNSDAPYSTKHLETRLDLSIVNRSYENKPPVIKSK